MFSTKLAVVIASMSLGMCGIALSQPQEGRVEDLRVRYFTSSMSAARHIDKGMKLFNQKKAKEALAEFREATQLDPECEMAHLWIGNVHASVGELDAAVVAFEKAYSLHQEIGADIGMEAAINAGLILAQAKQCDTSNMWLTRAILWDSSNCFKRQWIAYRNMSINCVEQRRFTAALLVAIRGHELSPENVAAELVKSAAARVADPDAAQVLWFGPAASQPEVRAIRSSLTEIKVATGQPEAAIAQLLPDPAGHYVVAVSRDAKNWWLITGGEKPTIRKVTPGDPVTTRAAQLVGGRLFVSSTSPNRLVQLDPQSGEAAAGAEWPLGEVEPTGLAVMPSQFGCYWAGKDKKIRWVDFFSRWTQDCEPTGDGLTANPMMDALFCFVHDEPEVITQRYIVNGQPLTVQHVRGGNEQTPLLQYAGGRGFLLLGGFRDKAAVAGRSIVVSPQGRWVALLGGASGVTVFPATNLEGQGRFFKADASPLACAFNAVTGQLAVIAAKTASIYHMSDNSTAVNLTGSFGSAAAFTGDGGLLIVAEQGGGRRFFRNELTAAERTNRWWANLPRPRAGSAIAGAAAPAPWLAKFTLSDDQAAVERLVKDALSAPPATLPTDPSIYPAYRGSRAWPELCKMDQETSEGDDGVRVYRLRGLLKKYPDMTMIKHDLAKALYGSGQDEPARDMWTKVIQAEQGRSRLTLEALYGMAISFSGEKKDLPALACLAVALRVDPENPITMNRMLPFLEKNKFADAAKEIVRRLAATESEAWKIPALPVPPAAGPKLAASAIYERAVPAVVQVVQGGNSSTGVCIADDGTVLTNCAAVTGGYRIKVFPYVMRDGKPVRLEGVEAKVAHVYPKLDLAILQPVKPIETLKPLPMASAGPRPGAKVFVVGNPAMGQQVLDLSITDGIVSNARRVIDGKEYVQHTAAVNPGSFGGPLIDESGQIVGLVTRGADLEGVGFAMPVSVIRPMFETGK